MNLDAAISLLLALVDNAQRVSTVIAQAKAGGRTHLSEDEWRVVLAAADAARAALEPPARVAPPADPTAPGGVSPA